MNKIIVLAILFSFAFAVDTKAKIKEDFTLTGFIQKQDGRGVKGAKISIYNDQDKELASGKSKKGGEFKIKRKLKVGNYLLIAEHKKEGRGESEFEIINNDLDLIVIILNENEKDTVQESDTLTTLKEELIELPRQKRPEEKDQLKFESTFFEYENSLAALKAEIDSLKTVVKGYEKKQIMPNVDRDILDVIKVPTFQNRIELQNGTVVMGDILLESDSSLTLKTQIGKLVLKKEMVIKMDKLEKPGPKVVFIGEPFIDYYPNKQVFSGKIKNIGDVRADFVRVSGKLFDQTTSNVGIDSVFVKGARIVYKTNVVADTALEPGQIASYTLTVPIMKGRKPEYHTMDIHWKETR